MKNNKKFNIILAIAAVVAVIVMVVTFWYLQVKKPHDIAVENFNLAKANVEKANAELDIAITDLELCLESGDPLLHTTKDNANKALDKANESKINIPILPKETAEILKSTGYLSQTIDYSEEIEQLRVAKKDLEEDIKRKKQLTNPSETFILEKVKTVKGVTDAQAVTEDNDPNGNLNKQGGYTSAVFFSYDLINFDEVYGVDLIDKGTSAGGCVEVYRTEADAKSRNDYLATYDGSVLKPGSHYIIGTAVIRTSSELTSSEQFELTANIFIALGEL